MIRLEINGWEAHIGFSAAHILPEHDKCGRLHGHNYAIHARVEGAKGEQGFVLDFIPLKGKLRDIANELDHRIILPAGTAEESENEISIKLGSKRYVFPREDVLLLDIRRSTAEELAGYVLKRLLEELEIPDSIVTIEIGVDESRGQGAWVKNL